jgi:phospholipase/carboxylesterase
MQPAPAPALVLLHGLGANERDLFELGRQVAPTSHLISLRAPIELGDGAYSWFPVRFTSSGPVHDAAAAEASRVRIVAFLRGLRTEPAVDASRITLLGFSQGAMLSEAVALTEPLLVSRVVLIGGRTLPELATTQSTSRPKVLVLHGTKDGTVPYENGVRTNDVLRAAGYDVTFESFEAGHTVTPPMVESTRRWLEPR